MRTKFCPVVKGGYSVDSFKSYRLPTSIVTALVSASNQSLALNTWASYRTAEAHLGRCEADTDIRMRFPMNDRKVFLIIQSFLAINFIANFLS